MVSRMISLLFLLLPLLAGKVPAGVTEYSDKAEWESAAGSFTTIGFTGYPDDTLISDQYAVLGVLFTDGFDFINLDNDHDTFFDGAGLYGAGGIDLAFSIPMYSIALDFPGTLLFDLYSNGDLIYTSSPFGGGGVGHFAGLVSAESFDEASIRDWVGDTIDIDDLHFGPPIPGASGLGLLGVAFVGMLRRRRISREEGVVRGACRDGGGTAAGCRCARRRRLVFRGRVTVGSGKGGCHGESNVPPGVAGVQRCVLRRVEPACRCDRVP